MRTCAWGSEPERSARVPLRWDGRCSSSRGAGSVTRGGAGGGARVAGRGWRGAGWRGVTWRGVAWRGAGGRGHATGHEQVLSGVQRHRAVHQLARCAPRVDQCGMTNQPSKSPKSSGAQAAACLRSEPARCRCRARASGYASQLCFSSRCSVLSPRAHAYMCIYMCAHVQYIYTRIIIYTYYYIYVSMRMAWRAAQYKIARRRRHGAALRAAGLGAGAGAGAVAGRTLARRRRSSFRPRGWRPRSMRCSGVRRCRAVLVSCSLRATGGRSE